MTDLFTQAPYVRRSDTSKAAAQEIAPVADSLRQRVLRAIQTRGDATCDEIEVTLGMRHQTASARLRELVLGGFIEDTGTRRKTRSGRGAVVYAKVKIT